MISPFEAAAPDLNLPPAGPLLDASQGQTVQPLEYEKIDHPLRRRTDRTGFNETEPEGVEHLLKQQCASLEERLRLLTADTEQRLAAVTVETRSAARLEWQEELRVQIDGERRRIATTCSAFELARTSYFASVEAEVVRLALAIATRVLHREAKLDPLLLGAVVRVALEKVADESGTVLHVPVQQVEGWRQLLADAGHSSVAIVGEEQMEAADCTLSTNVGRVGLGVLAQLDEIEKGFFDLMQQRPI